jgi:hypothetical protein
MNERKLEELAVHVRHDGERIAQLERALRETRQLARSRSRALYLDIIRVACAALGDEVHPPDEPELPAMDLLRKLVSGEGGRRTGDLMRRGWIEVRVTPAGEKALADEASRPVQAGWHPGRLGSRERLQKIVDEQAEDAGLWTVGPSVTAPEAYLQEALRRLHAAIEAAVETTDG